MKFTQHYSGSAVCAPSRCCLLTGKHSGHAYIRINDEMYERGDVWKDPSIEGQRPLEPGTVTIGSLLQAAGYKTAAVGKWGLKGSLYEGGIRVPMIARWPGKIRAGSWSCRISAFWDFLFTFTRLAGAETPGGIDGISLLSTFLGKNGGQPQHRYLYWEHARKHKIKRNRRILFQDRKNEDRFKS